MSGARGGRKPWLFGLSMAAVLGCHGTATEARRAEPVPQSAPAQAASRDRQLSGGTYACRYVAGTFTNVFKQGPDCSAGNASTCTEGRLEGDLQGAYAFFFGQQQPAGDPAAPSRQTFVGHSDVRLEDGSVLSGNDFGDITFRQDGPSPFRTLIDVRGESGPLQGAVGHILARGEANMATGQGGGTYSGELCQPDR